MRPALLLSLSLLVGCVQEGEIWLLSIGAVDPEVTGTCAENFVDLDCPVLDGGAVGDWTTETTTERSNQILYALVEKGPKGAYHVTLGETVLTETMEKKELKVSYERFTDETNTSSHTSGYAYDEESNSMGSVELTLTEKGGILEGSMTTTTTIEGTWRETDDFDGTATGLFVGAIPSYDFLIGDPPENLPDSVECEADDCTITLETTTTLSQSVSGEVTKFAPDTFPALENSGWAAGF